MANADTLTVQPSKTGDLTTDRTASPNESTIDSFSYNDTIVRWFVGATIVWALVATIAGLLVGLLLVLPTAFSFLPPQVSALLTFGRLRPVHTNAAIFAFAGNAVFAAVYYSTQRLCKARMWSDAFGWLHFWGWQAIIVAAAVTLPMGLLRAKSTPN